ncbi:MAG: hypothetical protein J6Q30_07225 [Oscillospiraceae bacterium]|nr:hypothetical protein [Oscillospiraceae bacterium]
MKTILCYGDSNTWGCVPGVLTRHPKEVRWTSVLERLLGDEYEVITDGINGRTTMWDDPENQCRNGLKGLGYSLYRAKPLDLVIVMLGTNDDHYTDNAGYRDGLYVLADRIMKANKCFPGTSPVFPGEPKLLLISPIERTVQKFPEMTAEVAEKVGAYWMDAAQFAKASPADGCHMDAENHLALGQAVYEKVKEIL